MRLRGRFGRLASEAIASLLQKCDRLHPTIYDRFKIGKVRSLTINNPI
ncbi:hypothetical protein [Aulosira sp. FACHB-615]|nr:hypothetical protein [Aulosira sp. FACHB-615]MBD2491990.1 hypothetical protein [Aulosira sp. FACHB-615]